jgi:hypothetical protein
MITDISGGMMLKSGDANLMDAQADQWHKNLEGCRYQRGNILNFEQLHLNKMDVFERGIINVFKGCRGITKPIVPAALVKKIIVNNLVTHSRWGFSLNWGWRGIN